MVALSNWQPSVLINLPSKTKAWLTLLSDLKTFVIKTKRERSKSILYAVNLTVARVAHIEESLGSHRAMGTDSRSLYSAHAGLDYEDGERRPAHKLRSKVNSGPAENILFENPGGSHQCSRCGKGFPTAKGVSDHMRRELPNMGNI